MLSDVLTPYIPSLYTFSAHLLRTYHMYKALGQSAQRWNIIERWIEVGLYLI